MLDHIELYTGDFPRARRFWEFLLGFLGYDHFQAWPEGQSWRKGDFYLVLVQAREEGRGSFHRCRPGLNHIAFRVDDRDAVDRLTERLRERGVTILYEDRHPFAGGAEHYAVYFEDPERLKVEVVAGE